MEEQHITPTFYVTAEHLEGYSEFRFVGYYGTQSINELEAIKLVAFLQKELKKVNKKSV